MPAEKWKRVTDAIRTSITTGEWEQGQRLPLTSELAATFHTSRATIAHALSQLGREGWITYISRNSGWQVAAAKRRRRMSRNRMTSAERAAGRGGFLTDAAQANRPAVVRTEVASVEPPAEVAALLELEPGDRTVRRHRLMYLGDQPAQDDRQGQRRSKSIPAAPPALPVSRLLNGPGDGGRQAEHEYKGPDRPGPSEQYP